eukprot:gene35118-45462_t
MISSDTALRTVEQCIVGMCKTGISHLATYNNVDSCGRGKYFFRLVDFDVLERSFFEELNSMSVGDATNPLGIQFRAFVYVTKISNSSRSAANVGDAISMVSDDVEKYNAMAILGGVVDFQRIPNGIYSSAITTDNNSNKAASGSLAFQTFGNSFSRKETGVKQTGLHLVQMILFGGNCVVRMDAFTERKVYEQMQKQHPPTEDTIGTELFADDIGSLISGEDLAAADTESLARFTTLQ